jgi:hypothetical protein
VIVSHYQLRRDIATNLSRSVFNTANTVNKIDSLFKLAFCYELGFGVPRNESVALSLLKLAQIPPRKLYSAISAIRPDTKLENESMGLIHSSENASSCLKISKLSLDVPPTRPNQSWIERSESPDLVRVPRIVFRLNTEDHFRTALAVKDGISLANLKLAYQQEISDLSTTLGDKHIIVFRLQAILLYILQHGEAPVRPKDCGCEACKAVQKGWTRLIDQPLKILLSCLETVG